MANPDNEDERLRAVAQQNAQSIRQARRRAEEELRRQTEWLRVTLASIGDAVISTDAEGRVSFMNGVAESLTGWSLAEALGHRLTEVFRIVNEQSRQPVENPALRALKEGTIVGLANHTILIAKDNTERLIDDCAAPIRSPGGEILGAVLIFRDTTGRYRAEAALRASEERFRALFELAPLAVYSCDAAGVIERFNRGAAELWGREPAPGDSAQRFCGSLKLRRLDGTLMRHEESPMADVLRNKLTEVRDAEVIMERPDGSRITVIANIRLLKNERGEVTGAISCFYDVTERKRAEDTRALLAAIVGSSDDAIVSKTLEGIITTWNIGAQRLLGYSPEEIIGQSITTIIPPDRLGEEREIQKRVRRNERVEHYETVRVAKDGRHIEVSLSISPIRDQAGRIIGASKIARDISERRRGEEVLRLAQAQLADRAGQLEQAVSERTAQLSATNEQLETFVYSIAHDLRAPLRSMTGFSQLLLQDHAGGLNEVGQDLLKRIRTASEFMDEMLLDLLAYGSTSRVQIELGPVEISEAWKTALFQSALQVEQSGAQIEVIEPLPMVRAHQAMLGQCLANLLSNAMKFVPAGVRPHIRFWAEEIAPAAEGEAPTIRLWMEDNGIGIAPEHRERAFRIFERLQGTRYPGTGIGLSIVRKGIERMGGRVGMESVLGRGTRFWLELTKG